MSAHVAERLPLAEHARLRGLDLGHCSRCRRRLKLSAFPRNRTKPSGRGSWCRRCQRDVLRAYRATPRGRAASRASYQRELELRPEARRARARAQAALRAGRLVRPARCEWCSKPGTLESHHVSAAPGFELRVLHVHRECHAQLHRDGLSVADVERLAEVVPWLREAAEVAA